MTNLNKLIGLGVVTLFVASAGLAHAGSKSGGASSGGGAKPSVGASAGTGSKSTSTSGSSGKSLDLSYQPPARSDLPRSAPPAASGPKLGDKNTTVFGAPPIVTETTTFTRPLNKSGTVSGGVGSTTTYTQPRMDGAQPYPGTQRGSSESTGYMGVIRKSF